MTKTTQWILLTTALVLLGCAPGEEVDEIEAPEAQRPPNVVLIVADDLGWRDVSFNGGDIATPNIDRIAAEGVKLERFYVAPICSPTRAGLMTGRHPIRYGMMRGVVMGYHDYGLDPEATLIPQVLAEPGYSTDLISEHAVRFVREHAGAIDAPLNYLDVMPTLMEAAAASDRPDLELDGREGFVAPERWQLAE